MVYLLLTTSYKEKMDGYQFSMEALLEANYLNIALKKGDRLDEIAMKVIREDCPDFLVPFRMSVLNDSVTLKYKLANANATALAFMSMTLHKQEFLEIYLNLLSPFIKGKDWFLDYRSLCIDPQYVYLNKHSHQVSFIYVPTQSYKNTDEGIIDFLKGVFLSAVITDDKDFEVRMLRFFGNKQVTLLGLYQLLLDEKGKTGFAQERQAQNFVQPKPAPDSIEARPQPMAQPDSEASVQEAEQRKKGLFGSFGKKDNKGEKPVKDQEEIFSKEKASGKDFGKQSDADDDDVINMLLGNGKKTKKKPPKKEKLPKEKKKIDEKKPGKLGGLFGGRKKEDDNEVQEPARQNPATPISEPQPEPEKPFPPLQPIGAPLTDPEITEYYDDEQRTGEPWLELLDMDKPGAMNRINLVFTKPYLIIGRMSSDEMKPDIAFPAKFRKIGRQHLRIEKRDETLFAIDLGSINHSMIDGELMAPNYPYQLRDGAILAFNVNNPLRYRVHL